MFYEYLSVFIFLLLWVIFIIDIVLCLCFPKILLYINLINKIDITKYINIDFFFDWLFKGLDSYFDHEIHYEKDNYDFENKNYIKILMPHGIIPYSYFCIKGNRNNKLFNKKKDKLAIMHQFFNFPLFYFCGKILNVIPSKYDNMENVIKNNKSLIVYLGGVRETFSTSEKEEEFFD